MGDSAGPGHSERAEATPRVARRALLGALCASVVLVGLAACGGRGGATYRPRERVPTVPIGQSDRERPNKLTYYLASVTQKGEVVVVDLDLMNGHARGFSFITVWITLLGTNGEKQQINHAVGSVGPHSTNHVVARSKTVPFQVDTIEVGLQIR